MAGHVFISYSRKDTGYVTALIDYLTAAGIPVWVDHDIDYGGTWTSVIRDHIDTCAAFVPVMTPNAESSTWVLREVSRAEAVRREIFPLLLEGMPFFHLGHLQHEDVRDGRMPSAGFVEQLQRLTAPPPPVQPVPAPVPKPAPVRPEHAELVTVKEKVQPARSPVTTEPVPAPTRVSRRTVLLAGAGTAAAIAVPGVIWATNRSGGTEPPASPTPTDGRLGSVYAGGAVLSLSVSADSRLVATATTDNKVKLWSVADRRQVGELAAGAAIAVCFSPDGRQLATIGANYPARLTVWNVASKEKAWSGGSSGRAVAFSNTGLLAVPSYAGLDLYTVGGSILPTMSLDSSLVLADLVSMTTDGAYAAAAPGDGDGRLFLYNLRTRRAETYSGHSGQVLATAFSPSGSTLASAGADGTVRLWKVPSGGRGYSYLVGVPATSVTFSGDGSFVAAGDSKGRVHVWRTTQERLVTTLTVGTYPVSAVAFLPDGSGLVSGSLDGTLAFWPMPKT